MKLAWLWEMCLYKYRLHCLTGSLQAHVFPKVHRVPALNHNGRFVCSLSPPCVLLSLDSRWGWKCSWTDGLKFTVAKFCCQCFGFGAKTRFCWKKIPYLAIFYCLGWLVGWLNFGISFSDVCHPKKITIPLGPSSRKYTVSTILVSRSRGDVSCSGVRCLKELWEGNGNSHSHNSDTVMAVLVSHWAKKDSKWHMSQGGFISNFEWKILQCSFFLHSPRSHVGDVFVEFWTRLTSPILTLLLVSFFGFRENALSYRTS